MISYPLTAGGTTTRVIEAGRGTSGLVFLHGVTAYAHRWNRNLEGFAAAGYRACAFDLPGHGFATKDAGFTYSVPGYAAFLGTFLDAMNLEAPALVGTSLGAHIAALFACRNPDRVRALILVGALGLVPVGETIRQAIATAILDSSRAGLRTKLQRAHANPNIVTDDWIEEEFHINNSAGAKQTFEQLGAYIAQSLDDDCVGATLASLVRRIPTLLVWGEHDRSVGLAVAKTAHAALPGTRLVVIRNTGHAPYFERPDAFNTALTTFLTGGFDAVPPDEVIER
jgi:2-hydroxy-6-oxonona-2,4-dienedioate hydrolase